MNSCLSKFSSNFDYIFETAPIRIWNDTTSWVNISYLIPFAIDLVDNIQFRDFK